MASTLRRVIAAAGTTALIAGAAIVVAPAAHADGDYYGTWTLTAIRADAQKVKCEGPEAEGVCPGGQTLTLKSNYRFKASAFLAQMMWLTAKGSRKGSFATPVIPHTEQQVLVIQSDRGQIMPLGSAWQIELEGYRSGSPTKMVLTLQTGFGEYTLILRRDAN